MSSTDRLLDRARSVDDRVGKVIGYARERYREAGLVQHNWEHICRDLHRALVIADTEEDVDRSILVPAVILHDIGATEGPYEEHVERSIDTAREVLPGLGYRDAEIESIADCIAVTGSREPATIEEKIMYDADLLEKSGIVAPFYRYQYERGIPLAELIEDALPTRKRWVEAGFCTRKAREMDGGGLEAVIEHLEAMQTRLEERPDFRNFI